MPRLQYITVRESDFGAGIDQQSAENRIKEGYCEDIENADPQSTGHIVKRKGYQGYAGYVPVRVKEIEYTNSGTNNYKVILDDSIELPSNRSQPLIILGKTSSSNTANSGDFPNDSEVIKYYSSFVADIRRPFLTGTNTLTIPQTEHDLTTEFIFVGVSESTSEIENDHSRFYVDSIAINKTTKDIDITYTNNTGSEFTGFVWLKDKSGVTGTTFVGSTTTSGAVESITTGTNSYVIPGSLTNLDNNNLIVKVFEDDGTDLIELNPEEIHLNESTGDVEVTIDNNTGSSFNAYFVITSAPDVNFTTGSVADGASQSITIDTSVTNGTDFTYISCYLEPGGGADLEQVIPDSIVHDASTNQTTVTFTNNTGSGANFEVYWDWATISTSSFTITGTTGGTSYVDTAPQLTVWGFCHEEIYGIKVAREGWTTHIDSYRAPAENRLISGLGGNLFAARLRAEGTNSTDYLMPLLYPRLQARLLDDTIIGPAFYDTAETPARTRGYVTGTDGGDNLFTITNVAYNSGTGYVDYTISVPNMAILDSTGTSTTISNVISTTTGLEDQLTASQCGYAIHNGTFTIKAVASGVDELIISVDNPNLDASDYDESDVGGDAGIFSDHLVFTAASPFLPDDILNSELFSTSITVTAINTGTLAGGSPGTETTAVSGIIERVSLPGGLRIVGQRTSSIIPLRDLDGNSTVENLVRGDMLQYTGINRQLKINSVNPVADISLSITGDLFTAVATLGSGDTSSLFIGKNILITGSTNYNGVQTVTAITSSTTFEFATTLATTETATLVGNVIEVDENLTFADTTDSSNTLNVHGRWIPIESPEDSFDATPKTRVRYFDTNGYAQQEIIRSTMVQDNLYLTNDDDEVMKFDGTNLYRAGLFRWQPNLFVTTDTTVSGKIVTGNTVVDISQNSTTQSNNGGYFFIDESDRGVFRVGDQIQNTFDGEIYTVTNIEIDTGPTHAHVYVDRKITAGTTTADDLVKISSFKYYFRLNAVDANDNVVASAVTGSDDFVVQLGDDAAVNIRLVGMPTWDIYDYDRLEVQIYRTKADSDAPFYRLTTLSMNFDNAGGYIDYTDTDSDEDLINLDEVNTALKGAELGTAWAQPMRAKYCTSAGNRLILGNLKDYPNLDLRVLKTRNILTQSVFTNASNKDWLFRKDNTSAATGTDMVNTVNYEFVATSGATTITGVTPVAGTSLTFATGTTPAVGDWVYVFHAAVTDATSLEASGWYQVNSVNAGVSFTVLENDAPSSLTGAFPTKFITASVAGDVPVPIGTDGNFSQLNGNRTSTEPYEFVAMKRLAEAINCTMRKTDRTISGQENFEPWMVANAGNEYNVGQVVIRQPRIFSTSMEVVVPALTGDFDVFANNVKRTGGANAGALTRLFPSRIIASYSNYAEIFDAPTENDDSFSDSAIDINSADGQEITAIIPFFGDAAFGAAQKSGIVVVFKTNSIYLVDLAAKDAGTNPVQKLETRGKGCTAPYSVSVTRGGIMFANDTGIYRLNRNLTVDYIGRKYERKFRDTVNKDQLAIATGHHDTEANSYKLSYPLTGANENSTVAVYNHTREYEQRGDGSWTTYTNHPATGWTNLDAESYFASTDGRVYIIRRLNETSDYRDDSSAIAMTVITRALDALDSGRRKVHSKIITHYRVPSESVGTALFAALDLKTVFQATDAFQINQESQDGLGDNGNQKVVTISSVIDSKVGVYIQLKYTNSTIDETVEITGIDLRVAAKSDEGILEARETTS